MITTLFHSGANVNFTIDIIRPASNISFSGTKNFTNKSFLYTMLSFKGPKDYSRPLGRTRGVHPEGFIQKIPRNDKNEKPINITGNDKV